MVGFSACSSTAEAARVWGGMVSEVGVGAYPGASWRCCFRTPYLFFLPGGGAAATPAAAPDCFVCVAIARYRVSCGSSKKKWQRFALQFETCSKKFRIFHPRFAWMYLLL